MMQFHRLALLALLACLAGALSAADHLAGLRFSDGSTREQVPGHGLLLVNFCGHCPSARAFMAKQVKEAHDYIEREKLPTRLVCVTPELEPDELAALGKEIGLGGAWLAKDPANREDISTRNILQCYQVLADGSRKPLYGSLMENLERSRADAKAGAHRFPGADSSDARFRELWWMVERSEPQALRSLSTVAAKKSGVQAEASALLDGVKAWYAAQAAELVAAPASMVTLERCERLLADADGIAVPQLAERSKALAKDPALKDELQARTLYRQCQMQLASAKPKEQQAGAANLAKLAERFPATVYGAKAR